LRFKASSVAVRVSHLVSGRTGWLAGIARDLPLASKERLDRSSAFNGQNAPGDLDPMIQLAVVQYPQCCSASACLGVRRAVNCAPQSCLHNRSGAHGTRFNCNIQVATLHPVVAQFSRGASQGQNFRMRGWIMQPNGPVVGARQHLSFPHHDCAHRNFTFAGSALCFTQRHAHESFIGGPLPASGRNLLHSTIVTCPQVGAHRKSHCSNRFGERSCPQFMIVSDGAAGANSALEFVLQRDQCFDEGIGGTGGSWLAAARTFAEHSWFSFCKRVLYSRRPSSAALFMLSTMEFDRTESW